MTATNIVIEPTAIVDLTRGHTDHKERQNLAALTGLGRIQSINVYQSSAFDPACIVNNASLDTALTGHPACVLGDIVLGVGLSIDKGGLAVTGGVTANGTVTLTFENNSGSAVNLASLTATYIVAHMAPNLAAGG